jgi:hypothetical protein
MKYIIFDYLDIFTALKCLEIDIIFTDEMIWKRKALQYNSKRRKDKSWAERCKYIAQKKYCDDCQLPLGKKFKIFFNGISLCFKCLKTTIKFIFIDECDIRFKYMLEPVDYKDIESINAPNLKCKPIKISIKQTYYNENDIIKKFCDKYNIQKNEVSDKIEKLKNEKKEQQDLIERAWIAEKKKREMILSNELNKYKLQLRSDSKLCNGYINGTLNKYQWTVQTIVTRMCEVKFLFDYCNMAYYLNRVHQNARKYNEYRYKYRNDDDDDDEEEDDDDDDDDDDDKYRDNSQELFDEAEIMALRNHCGKYPQQWPWL